MRHTREEIFLVHILALCSSIFLTDAWNTVKETKFGRVYWSHLAHPCVRSFVNKSSVTVSFMDGFLILEILCGNVHQHVTICHAEELCQPPRSRSYLQVKIQRFDLLFVSIRYHFHLQMDF